MESIADRFTGDGLISVVYGLLKGSEEEREMMVGGTK